MQRKRLLFVASLLFAFFVFSGTTVKAQPGTASFNPDADLEIVTTYGCAPSIWPLPSELMNWDGYGLSYGDWTISALGCGNVSSVFLVRFGTMALPVNAHVISARLNLFGPPPPFGFTPQGNSYYPGTPFGPNPGYVDRVVRTGAGTTWNEGSETWSSFFSGYAASGSGVVPTLNMYSGVPHTTSQWNENFSIDVTNLTKDIIAAGTNDGYILYLQSTPPVMTPPAPVPYQSVVFEDRTNTSGTPQPQLVIDYYICNANFTFCGSTNDPLTYRFNAVDPGFPGATYEWIFGDGSHATGPGAIHHYPGPGTYTACLRIIDSRGQVLCEECTTFCITKERGNGDEGVPAAKTPAPSNTDARPSVAKKYGEVTSFYDKTLNIMKVSPNPAHSRMDVSLLLLKKATVHYKVYDIAGKELMKDNAQINAGKQTLTLSIDKLQPGIYILKMDDGYTTTEYKFTKE